MFKGIFGSTKKERDFSASPSVLDQTESQAQSWLNQVYTKELRNQIKSLEISGEWLSGLLDLTDFVNLEELYCYDNKLTGIKFADSSLNKLRVLHIGNNDFLNQDLSLFSHFVALEMLNLSNNDFIGSLWFLEDLVNLQSLDISDTNIDSGLSCLPKSLKSLFCRVEKEVRCQKIREELKNYHLGHDCYDFQAWRKVENLLTMPGSWEGNNIEKEISNVGLDSIEAELLSEEDKFLTLINDIYQDLILVEEEKSSIMSIKKNLEKFRSAMEEMQKQEGNFNFDNFRNKFRFNPHDLVLVAERYVLAKEKENILHDEERTKKLRQNNILIAKAKDELLHKTLCEVERYQTDISNLQNLLEIKKEEIVELEETIIKLDEINEKTKNEKEILQAELTKQNEEIFGLKEQIKALELKLLKDLYKKNNYKIKTTTKIINDMTGNNNKTNEQKVFILEWKGAELKGGTMRYEKFAVIAGSDEESLSFYSTFFTDNIKFKKGDVYQFSTSGSLVQDSSEIIQGISKGSHEFEKTSSSLLIKELWETNQENIDELDLVKKEFETKKENYNKINQELLTTKNELSNLQNKFNSLQVEKEKKDKSLEKVEKELASQKEESQKKAQQLVSSEAKVKQLDGELSKLQTEKNDVENERITQERYMKLLQEKESLKTELKSERKKRQFSDDRAEEIIEQGLDETIETKSQVKKNELQQLKFSANEKLGNGQKSLLKDLLEKHETLEWMLFEDANQKSRSFTQAQKKLQEAKNNLKGKLDTEEIEELCQIQTEVIKLEYSQTQWEEMKNKQENQKTKEENNKEEEFEEFESFTSVPPKKHFK